MSETTNKLPDIYLIRVDSSDGTWIYKGEGAAFNTRVGAEIQCEILRMSYNGYAYRSTFTPIRVAPMESDE